MICYLSFKYPQVSRRRHELKINCLWHQKNYIYIYTYICNIGIPGSFIISPLPQEFVRNICRRKYFATFPRDRLIIYLRYMLWSTVRRLWYNASSWNVSSISETFAECSSKQFLRDRGALYSACPRRDIYATNSRSTFSLVNAIFSANTRWELNTRLKRAHCPVSSFAEVALYVEKNKPSRSDRASSAAKRDAGREYFSHHIPYVNLKPWTVVRGLKGTRVNISIRHRRRCTGKTSRCPVAKCPVYFHIMILHRSTISSALPISTRYLHGISKSGDF